MQNTSSYPGCGLWVACCGVRVVGVGGEGWGVWRVEGGVWVVTRVWGAREFSILNRVGSRTFELRTSS